MNSFLTDKFDKWGRNNSVDTSIKASTAHEYAPRRSKMAFVMWPLQIVTTDFFNMCAILFKTMTHLSILTFSNPVICWLQSLSNPWNARYSPCFWSSADKMSSQFLYLRSDRTSQNLVIVTSPREVPRALFAHRKYPILPCVPHQKIPDTTPRALFLQIEINAIYTLFLLYFYLFFSSNSYTYICAGTTMMPPWVLASGPKPCGGNKSIDWTHFNNGFWALVQYVAISPRFLSSQARIHWKHLSTHTWILFINVAVSRHVLDLYMREDLQLCF